MDEMNFRGKLLTADRVFRSTCRAASPMPMKLNSRKIDITVKTKRSTRSTSIDIRYLPKVVFHSAQWSTCDVAVRSCTIPGIVELQGVSVIEEISGKGIAIIGSKIQHFRPAIFDGVARNDIDRRLAIHGTRWIVVG